MIRPSYYNHSLIRYHNTQIIRPYKDLIIHSCMIIVRPYEHCIRLEYDAYNRRLFVYKLHHRIV
jgi:hypothetical protein